MRGWWRRSADHQPEHGFRPDYGDRIGAGRAQGALANVEINLGSMKAETASEEEFASESRKRETAVLQAQ